MIFKRKFPLQLLVILVALIGCRKQQLESISILSFPEHRFLETEIQQFEKEYRTEVNIEYREAVEFIHILNSGKEQFTVLWPAHDFWLELIVSEQQIAESNSIMSTPVVLGIRRETAKEFGWFDKKIYLNDIYDKVNAGTLGYLMSSVTQTTSGAGAYFSFIENLSGETEGGDTPGEKLEHLLAGMERTSGRALWLKSLFSAGNYQAIIDYEAHIIQINQQFRGENTDSLLIKHPAKSPFAATSPLLLLEGKSDAQQRTYRLLLEHLRSEPVQQRISREGYRQADGNMLFPEGSDRTYEEWNIVKKLSSPAAEALSGMMIQRAFNTYQTDLRKPSLTVFCLDYSGSMKENGGYQELIRAMEQFLDQDFAAQHMAQLSDDDITIIFPYSVTVLDQWIAEGNDKKQLENLVRKMSTLQPRGKSEMYTPIITATDILATIPTLDRYLPAIILVNDGSSNEGRDYSHLRKAVESYGIDVPVFPVLFRSSEEEKLERISELTGGVVFDGRDDLGVTFIKIKGFN